MVTRKLSITLGPPGTGKTTEMLNKIEAFMEQGIPPEKIAFVSYTKKAVTEAAERAAERFNISYKRFRNFRTVHATCYNGLGITRNEVMGKNDYAQIGKMLGIHFSGYTDASEGLSSTDKSGDYMLQLINLAHARDVDVHTVWKSIDQELCWYELKLLDDTLREYKQDTGKVDFDDMLGRYVTARPKVDVTAAIIDEAQDLSNAQWDVVKVAFRDAQHIEIAGDDDQCQPAGTLIATPSGYVPIEDLEEPVLSYAIQDAQVYGKQKPFDVTRASRYYEGLLYTVAAGNRETRATPNHRWAVKWPRKYKSPENYCVYLMRRGENWRIGMTQMFNADGCSLFAGRLRDERADEMWILSVFNNKTDARVEEVLLAVMYRLPQITFHASAGAYLQNQATLDRIHSQLLTGPGACELLLDYSLLLAYPLLEREQTNRFGRQVFSCVTANLLPGMLVPTWDKGRTVTWCPLSLSDEVFAGTVYSLDVQKHHTYIADGIVTRNCIYQWSGANVERFMAIKGQTNVLEQSYRIPQSVHKTALNVISQVSNRLDKVFAPRDEAGSVQYANDADSIDFANGESWMLLARNAYFLKQYQEACELKGVPYLFRGKPSIDPDHVRAIVLWERFRSGEEMSEDDDMFLKPYRAGAGNDLVWFDALKKIPLNKREYYLSVLRCGYRLQDTPKILINTIHGVKGGEADNVALMTDMTSKSYDSMQLNADNEHRVFYVGATRARKNLHIIQPQTTRGYLI